MKKILKIISQKFFDFYKSILALSLKKKIIYSAIILFSISLILLFIFILPNPLFNVSYSCVVVDKNGELLGVKISDDKQWRFPETDSVNEKFKTCIVCFEDKRFYYHLGVDPLSIIRATKQNIKSSKIVSGASTITMQTIRLMRNNKKRSFYEKIIESLLAIRLECTYSKESILKLYASHAPFGGNIVGIDAASWRYFGRSQYNLSWAENAMLAVLPNDPTNINTAKNREKLKAKRDKLLKMLYEKNILSEDDYQLSIEEEIPQHPLPYPTSAYHLVERILKENKNSNNVFLSTIDFKYQELANKIIDQYNSLYKQNGINNIACIVLDVNSGEVLVYVGNAAFDSDTKEKDIDMILSNRSTGSILKPFLYAAALSDGIILPKTLLRDTPTKIADFSPENFDKQNDGAVPADEALVRSLNIPFVHLLKQYDVYKFLSVLRYLGLKSIDKSSDYYGLSLILGGAESNLWEISSAYASMARSLNYYNSNEAKYLSYAYFPAHYLLNSDKRDNKEKDENLLNAVSIYYTFLAMTELNRPGDEKNWRSFSSKQQVAWKTGTSFGFKDAWAVAINPKYVVAVWVGNATGEPKSDIIGQKVAAPVLFEILNVFPDYDKWFDFPYDNTTPLAICAKSGYIASTDCDTVDTVYVSNTAIKSPNCPYHHCYNFDETESYLVNSDCYPIEKIHRKSCFVLSPSMEYYYKMKNPSYSVLPPFLDGCNDNISSSSVMDIIYPNLNTRVYIPVNSYGDTLSAVFKVAHQDNNAKIFWYIDGAYVNTTEEIHEISVKLNSGKYLLTIVDNKGISVSRYFTVVNKD